MEYRFRIRKAEFDFVDGHEWSPERDSLETKASAEYNDAYADRAIEIVLADSETEAYHLLRDRIEDRTGWTVYKIHYDLT
jgi:hypothetical protein